MGALVIAAWLVPQQVTADDGNLTQQLQVQQHRSRFQLMLEQVEQRARQRAGAAQTGTPSYRGSPSPALGDWSDSVRLDPVAVATPSPARTGPDDTAGLVAQQAYERRQRQILDYRQQRSALLAGTRGAESNRAGSFQAKRRELVRFNAQNQRQSLQRKLRR